MSYTFNNKNYSTITTLANAMGREWDAGRAFLFSGQLRAQVRAIDKTLANSCQYYEKKYHEEPKKSSLLFLKWLTRIPGVTHLYWQGKDFGDIDKLCSSIKTDYDQTTSKLLTFMLQEQILSDFVKSAGRSETVVENVEYLERSYNKKGTKFNRTNSLRLLYVILKEDQFFLFDGQQFSTVQELASYLQTLADQSKDRIAAKVYRLFQDDANFTPEFEGWLLTKGYMKELTAWKDKFQASADLDSFDEEQVLLEDVEERREAQKQGNQEFAANAVSFDTKFTSLLENHPDAIESEQRFNGLLKDVFPDSYLQVYLIITLYKMDIVKAIQEAEELTDYFSSRFVNRMVKDFGIKEDFAKWAASMWCVCYGERVLNKRSRVSIFKIQ